jgi:hypothetical protein
MGARRRLFAGLVVIAVLLAAPGCAAAPVSSEPPVASVTGPAAGSNHQPVIENIVSEYHQIERGRSGGVRCIAHDEDGDALTYEWNTTRGSISGDGALATYTAPNSYVDAIIEVSINDGRGGFVRGSFKLPVVCCSAANKNSEWTG